MTITKTAARIAAAQTPRAGKLNLDHIAHFVPDLEAASAAFESLGFTLTPRSEQMQRPAGGDSLVPAGAANRCVMFERGYLECLTPTADTEIGNQLRGSIARYTGLHLIAFGTADADADYARLTAEHFAPLPPVDLQRRIGTPAGEETARFTVVRVPPGTMAEGRVQYCRQLTPEFLWQSRWTRHPNRATALTGVIVCVENPHDTAARYTRFTGIAATASGDERVIATARGRIVLVTPQAVQRVFRTDPPALPWIAGSILASSDMDATRACIVASGLPHGMLGEQRLYTVPPAALGGFMVFEHRRIAPFSLSA